MAQLIASYKLSRFALLVCAVAVWIAVREIIWAWQGRAPWSEVNLANWAGVVMILALLIGFFGRVEVSEHWLRLSLAGWCYHPKTMQIRWHEVQRILENNFLGFWHAYVVMTGTKYLERGTKDIYVDNFICWKYKDLLREVVVRVPPTTIVDPPILDRIGFTQDDIGKLYKPPPETADS